MIADISFQGVILHQRSNAEWKSEEFEMIKANACQI